MIGGARRVRTADPLHAMQMLYQLSYSPTPLNRAAYSNLNIHINPA